MYSRSLVTRASQAKGLFFDVDGVWTNGRIVYDDAGRELKSFSVKDGQIVSHLRQAGIITGLISGRESAAVSKRAHELRLDFCHQGIVDKADVFLKVLDTFKLKRKEVIFIGDDINDLGVFDVCGISVCPSDAPVYVRKRVDIVTKARGGEGVVREIADMVLAAKGYLKKLLES